MAHPIARQNEIVLTGINFKPARSYSPKSRAGKMEKVSQKVVTRNCLESLDIFAQWRNFRAV